MTLPYNSRCVKLRTLPWGVYGKKAPPGVGGAGGYGIS